ncbi:MAG: hypothetical protein JRH20_00945 [Deltaproteobacteria bacterium]|nr:hypothetical protein [Deltaproteobacteria bacterium]
MQIYRSPLLCMLLSTALLACGPDSSHEPVSTQSPSVIVDFPSCEGLPAGIHGARAREVYDGGVGLSVYQVPAYPLAGEELFFFVKVPGERNITTLDARVTYDKWVTHADLPLQKWCATASTNWVWGISLGSHGAGTSIETAVHQVFTSSWTHEPRDGWGNNRGANYRFDVESENPLEWVGDTHLRTDGGYLPAEAVGVGYPLDVYTQTYPMGSARQVELFWANSDYSRVQSASMTLDTEHVGSGRNNDQWRATLPVELVAGEELHYWVRSEDASGQVRWDSAGGGNYHVTPRTYDVVWGGGFGSYYFNRDGSGSYSEGGLFNADGSTSTGCWTRGGRLSSTRAIRIYVPGLTDRTYTGDAESRAASRALRAELYTNARSGGWTTLPMRFLAQVGNDFVFGFQFVRFAPGCILNLPDGDYEYKIRVSGNAGHDWFWIGTEAGPDGGANRKVGYQQHCSALNQPDDCMPKSTASLTVGTLPAFGEVAAGEVATATGLVVNTNNAGRVVSNIRITGADAALFTFVARDGQNNSVLDPAGPIDLSGPRRRIFFDIVYAPPVGSSGTHRATLEMDVLDPEDDWVVPGQVSIELAGAVTL